MEKIMVRQWGMGIYGNSTNHVMWAVSKRGMMAWLRTLGILGYRSYGVNLLRGWSRKSWKNMENHGLMASLQGNHGVSLDFTLNKLEEQNYGWHVGCVCISSSVIPSQNWTKEKEQETFYSQVRNMIFPYFPLSQSNHSGCFPPWARDQAKRWQGCRSTGGPLPVFKQLLVMGPKNGVHEEELHGKWSASRKTRAQQLKSTFSRTLFIASRF